MFRRLVLGQALNRRQVQRKIFSNRFPSITYYSIMLTMDAATRQQYLADDPPTIVPLLIKPHFEALTPKEQQYAHWISKAAFSGTRIILRQISPESEPVYDVIVSLHKSCNGE